MIIGLPRSGTAWAANLFTTDTTHCIHDPLGDYHYSELDSIKSDKELGIACTAIWAFKDFVNNHNARKVIIHRDISEINFSLENVGLPYMPNGVERLLHGIDGFHILFDDFISNPKEAYEYLLGKKFDSERFSLLKNLLIERDLNSIDFNSEVFAKLSKEMKGAICQ